jgi:hypothetical protein
MPATSPVRRESPELDRNQESDETRLNRVIRSPPSKISKDLGCCVLAFSEIEGQRIYILYAVSKGL